MNRRFAVKIVATTVAFSMALAVSPMIKTEAAKKKPKLSQSTLGLGKGEKATLKVKKNKNKISKVTWKSTKKKIATVSKKGVVTAKAEGSATIKATFKIKGAKKKTTLKCAVTVFDYDPVVPDWETAKDPQVDDTIKDAVAYVQENSEGLTIEPLALLATCKIGSSNHYRVLTKVDNAVDKVKYYAIWDIDTVHSGEVVGYYPLSTTRDIIEPFPTAGTAVGQMTQTASPVIDETYLAYYETFKKSMQGGFPYTPVALVGTQVTNGISIAFLAETTYKDDEGVDVPAYNLIKISVDPTAGTAALDANIPFTLSTADYSVGVGEEISAGAVEYFASKMKSALIRGARGDWKDFASMIDYTIPMELKEGVTAANAEEFIAAVTKNTVSETFIRDVMKAPYQEMFANGSGVAVANGLIWINYIDGKMVITAINGLLG